MLWFIPMFWDPMQLILDNYLVSKFANVYPESDIPDYVYDFSFYYFNSVRTIFVIGLLALITRTRLTPLFAPFNIRLVIPSLEITLYTFFASSALVYLTFFPMAFVVPNFVEFWFINAPPLVHMLDGKYLFWPNILSFLSLTVLAPVTEELVFRGILLQRWGSKYNSRVAILLSSAVFASLHTDPLGAFLFGVLMCYLAICSKGILLPILCHSLYNALVWFISFFEHAVDPYAVYTLAEFQGEWMHAIVFILIGVAWGVRLQAKIPKMEVWRIPVLYK